MSRLVFRFQLSAEPQHADDLVHMRVARAIVAAALSVPAKQLSDGLRIGQQRVASVVAYAERIPRAWIDAADALVRRKLCDGYEWHGEMEEESLTMETLHYGRKYRGVLYPVNSDEL